MSETQVVPYRVKAFNTATASENKIHDDAVARRFGFAGGLVPGVEIYAYMTHVPIERWGRAWLEAGSAECRFLEPVYDGDVAVVTGDTGAGGIEIAVESKGVLCATGKAALGEAAMAPKLEDFQQAAPPAVRPPADERSLAPGTCLGIAPFPITPEFAAQYLANVRETLPLYCAEGLGHPGILLRLCNWALTHNVVLGPWIHVASKVQNFRAARVGEELSVRARISANYERKGHRFVELDALVIAGARAPAARILHTAIWRPRQRKSQTI
jgi:hypothetical protein